MTILTIQAFVAIARSFFGLWCYFDMIRMLHNESKRRNQQLDDYIREARERDRLFERKWNAVLAGIEAKQP